MSEIKVEPYVPDEDYDNPAMVTDFYEFTMANSLFLHGYKDVVMVFDMFYRENPDNLGYAISCGQHKLVRFLQNYRMLIYAIVLIVIMLVSNNEYLRLKMQQLKTKLTRKKGAPANE